MSHLNERIADYVFEELSSGEMAEAGRHIAECSDCRTQVENFQRTHKMLKTSPDVDPPRNIVFEFEKPVRHTAGSFWRWLAPVSAAAALVVGIAVAAPLHVQWRESQLTITFGAASQPADIVTLEHDVQQLQGAIFYLKSVQEQTNRDTMMNTVQLVAQRSEGRQ